MRPEPVTTALPIDDVLPAVLGALRDAGACALRAPTGAGKTTRVPPALLDSVDGKVLVLEPRRIAARAAAGRIAFERGGRLGDEVGYHVRFDRKAGNSTRLLVVTEGIFLRYLQDDPFLDGIDAVVVDEFHERSLQADLALGMIERVRRDVRDDLKVVVMSATLDVSSVAAFLDCPIVESEGRAYPVDVRYRGRFDLRDIGGATASAVRDTWSATAGSVLAFLPGVGEIQRVSGALGGTAQMPVLQLYGNLPPAQQDAVLSSDVRRVILATNVAETSVTVPGVTAVVDTGLSKVMRHDIGRGMNRLVLGPISRASADQRAGRAGRERPGTCLRLWPEAEQRLRPEFDEPEIHRVSLAGAALQLLAWGERDLERFPWFDAPTPAALSQANALLAELGAIGPGGVTEVGRHMARLATSPRLARLVVEGARRGVLPEAALAAAVLDARDPMPRGAPRASSSDLLDRMETARRGDRRFDIVRKQAEQLRKAAGRIHRNDPGSLDDALLAGFPDRVALRRKPKKPRAVMVGRQGVTLADDSSVREPRLFLALDLDAGRRGKHAEALVRMAHGLDEGSLPVHERVVESFDSGRERVVANYQVCYRDLVLTEQLGKRPDPLRAAALLAAAASAQIDRVVPLQDPAVAGYMRRVELVAEHMPELGMSSFDDDRLREVLTQQSHGLYSLDELRRLDWVSALASMLTWPQRQALDAQAPERVRVPSGKMLRLRYEADGPPVLAVRIQDMLGATATPTIAGGRVPVLLHLLAPNRRPAAITQDLPNFWAQVYPQVRKELRGRYPKHKWPEDPTTDG